jgi:hypothetical protein
MHDSAAIVVVRKRVKKGSVRSRMRDEARPNAILGRRGLRKQGQQKEVTQSSTSRWKRLEMSLHGVPPGISTGFTMIPAILDD